MEDKILVLLENTEKQISKILPKNYYLDDSHWGDDRFCIYIWKDYGIVNGKPKCERLTTYTFIYDEQDDKEYGISIDTQYDEWFAETLYWIEERFLN